MRSKRHLVSFLLVSACLLLTFLSNGGYQLVFSETQNQTIPTRTPTPPAEQPTEPPDDGGGEEPTAVPPTTTPVATATATFPAVTAAATPAGGFRPTSLPCGNRPTVQARNTINVRSGPGADYAPIGSLLYLEVRPIVGRAADATWWQIEWNDGRLGWVSDSVVVAQGYIDIVPVVPAPPINGHTPTPGTPWQPTPFPFCTVTPTSTATATATPTIQPTATGTVTPMATVATARPSASPTPTATSLTPTTTPTATPESQSVVEAARAGTSQPTAVPLDVAPPSSIFNFLPWASLILLAAGIFVVLARRRRTQA